MIGANSPSLDITSSTIAGNGTVEAPTPQFQPGGVSSNSDVTLTGSIISAPEGSRACSVVNEATVTDGGYNVVADDTCGVSESNGSLAETDPQLGALGEPGVVSGVMIPQAGSPALDLVPAGESCGEGVTDQRGIARPQGVACDAGAVEVEVELPEITTDTLPDSYAMQEYAVTLAASGGDGDPYEWAIVDSDLPDGLELDAATGEITGIPEVEGEFSFTVEVDGLVSKELTITVLPELKFVTESLPPGPWARTTQ